MTKILISTNCLLGVWFWVNALTVGYWHTVFSPEYLVLSLLNGLLFYVWFDNL